MEQQQLLCCLPVLLNVDIGIKQIWLVFSLSLSSLPVRLGHAIAKLTPESFVVVNSGRVRAFRGTLLFFPVPMRDECSSPLLREKTC